MNIKSSIVLHIPNSQRNEINNVYSLRAYRGITSKNYIEQEVFKKSLNSKTKIELANYVVDTLTITLFGQVGATFSDLCFFYTQIFLTLFLMGGGRSAPHSLNHVFLKISPY